jgi:hypothetical protein
LLASLEAWVKSNWGISDMNSRAFSRLAISVASVLFVFTSFANAGPTLICHPFEIGKAKSLPWVDWNHAGSAGYDLKNLTRDTLEILDSNAPVLVRMETLRRATIYARQNAEVAKELITRLQARAANSDAAGHPDALAWFDAGYLAETYKQWMGKSEPNPAAGLDGYSSVRKAIGLRGSDPEMEFAAALITLAGPENEHQDHVRKAMAGAKTDPLLAQNMGSNFHNQTITELLVTGRAAEAKQ